MVALGERIGSWWRWPGPQSFRRFEKMLDWLLYEIGLTRGGVTIGTNGLPLPAEGAGRLR